MSNPAPTLNQINAFNATLGTTISFNIIGGTEVIRSNKIYIYDLSDNSLICTHLYVSTESIHELPPNTSSSIVYASGKSSADFTNNTQYYAQIQTFTDTSGTQGASGLSIAKLFWCLPTPTLTLSTIPTTISTTSYNVSATYTPNTSGSATNEIQEFQFNLYSAIGALLQTSGVVLYGEGVDLSYNFSGLEVDSTYYVTLDVTTTQGMNVSAQSNTFTVSIDTPTMGSASVVNNGCDGYISVTSNLSSEYEHEESAEAGEIMSFTTDSVNDITELDVDFEPIQDGTPWMSAQDTEPYMFRAVPTQTEDFGHESDTIVGGTVGWNQLVQNGNFADSSGWAVSRFGLSVANNVATLTALSTVAQSGAIYRNISVQSVVGHKYLYSLNITPSKATTVRVVYDGYGIVGDTNITASANVLQGIALPPSSGRHSGYLYVYPNRGGALAEGDTVALKDFWIIDLTQMFGSTIADYIYSLETANAGAGVAWFRKLFPKPYYAYNAGELMSVNTSAHNTVGFNAWDEEWELGWWNYQTGVFTASSSFFACKSKIAVLPNTEYYWKCPTNVRELQYYDANGEPLGRRNSYAEGYANTTFTTPDGCYYLTFYFGASYGPTYKNDICINLSWDGERNGEYEEYDKHSYALDSDLVLRGIPKLDASNNLYYDGDTYESDGTVTRKYVEGDLAMFTWSTRATGDVNKVVSTSTSAIGEYDPRTVVGISDKYPYVGKSSAAVLINTVNTAEKGFYFYNSGTLDYSLYLVIPKNETPSGSIVFSIATPTTETADAYTNPQIVDPHGTEEYVGSPIPVGHKTTYQRICPITGWTGCEVDVAGVNLFDKSTSLDGYIENTDGVYHAAVGYKCTDYIKINGGDSYYIVSEQTAAKWGAWYDKDKAYISGITGYGGNALTAPNNATYIRLTIASKVTGDVDTFAVNTPSTDHDYHAYNGTTYPVSWQTEAGTVYGGTVDLVTGVLTVDRAMVDLGTATWYYVSAHDCFYTYKVREYTKQSPDLVCSNYPYVGIYADLVDKSCGYIYGNAICIRDSSFNQDTSAFKTAMNGVQLVYELETPIEISLTPQQMQTLSGQNNIWSNTNGGMYLVYQLPITSLLVKRRDVADISGKWLTLYSTPITQADDMDFTFIDFLNQYGKTYQYALVPVLEQDQSGVVVQIEGGYTVSDNVDSIFDGVYIADQTNVERVKAGVGYGNIDMNQGVGSITPIGSKYPIVITNSQNQYHNGSIRGTIVPNDFYSNGNLSRIDMVNKRDELEQFLTNKRAKIIKDWNGKMWLVMIMSNVACSFDDNYGMGMVSFSADWLEVGDPTNQQDLYNAGLINVGGV